MFVKIVRDHKFSRRREAGAGHNEVSARVSCLSAARPDGDHRRIRNFSGHLLPFDRVLFPFLRKSDDQHHSLLLYGHHIANQPHLSLL
jgi:hypothetical protein